VSLAVEGLSARYGRIEICRDITFEVAGGEILVVLGPNGAGKSTLMGAIAGAVAGAGEVRVGKTNLAAMPARERARRGLALVPEGRRNLFQPLSVGDNLRLGLRLLEPASERAAMREQLVALFPVLAERGDQPASMLSGGEQQMLAIAVAIARRPQALLLDEPSQGLAPVVLDRLVEAIGALRDQGLAILLAEQNHSFAARLADRFLVLQGGEIRSSGAGAELASRELAAAAMLGH
jgi:branched-chain amino acid transport system ATP-binding protein